MKVGFIGLGKMGVPMAVRLIKAGYDLGVFNRTAAKAADLVTQGAISLSSPGEAAAFGDIVITMVENDDALRQVAYGPTGMLASMSKGSIHVVMGTHSVALIETLAEAHSNAGLRLVTAPVLGRPPAAEAGQLGIIAGGDPDAVAVCQPLFEVLGRHTYDGGVDPTGAAAGKIAHNFILACAIEALGEGFALSRRFGLPAESLFEILTDGLFAAPAYKIYGKIMVDQTYFSSPGFSATTGLKDVMLALAAGAQVFMPLPSANVCRDRLLSAIADGHGDADWSVMAHEQARAGGLTSA
jgi:3-hydroxyisobutyrate dehydrogenase-like beta-hydroxyacid dehydrogenase